MTQAEQNKIALLRTARWLGVGTICGGLYFAGLVYAPLLVLAVAGAAFLACMSYALYRSFGGRLPYRGEASQ